MKCKLASLLAVTLVLADVHQEFALLGTSLSWVLILAAGAAAYLAHQRLTTAGKLIASIVLAGAVMAVVRHVSTRIPR